MGNSAKQNAERMTSSTATETSPPSTPPGRLYDRKARTNGRSYVTYSDVPALRRSEMDQLPDRFVYRPYTSAHMWDCSSAVFPNPYNATWKAIGECSGGTDWRACGCALTHWDQTNKVACCNPNPETQDKTLQSDSTACEPDWVPFSTACLTDQSIENKTQYRDYCLKNPNDPYCFAACRAFSDSSNVCLNNTGCDSCNVDPRRQRPGWCDNFIEAFCKLHGNDNDDYRELCKCQQGKTTSDICLLPECSNNQSSAWKSVDQYNTLNSPNGCGDKCAIEQTFQETGETKIDRPVFNQQCGFQRDSKGDTIPPITNNTPMKPMSPDSSNNSFDPELCDVCPMCVSTGQTCPNCPPRAPCPAVITKDNNNPFASMTDFQNHPQVAWTLVAIICLIVLVIVIAVYNAFSKQPQQLPQPPRQYPRQFPQ